MTDVLSQPFVPKNVVTMHPGPVGSVGDVFLQTRLKHSNPDLPLRWEYWNSGANQVFLGSNVQDGYTLSYVSSGEQARANITGGVRMGTRLGERIKNANKPTNLMEPRLGSLGDYDWRNKQAVVYNSNRTSSKFLPLPNGYQLPPGETPRAGGLTRTVITPTVPTIATAPIFGKPSTGVPTTQPPPAAPPGKPGSGVGSGKQGRVCNMPRMGKGTMYRRPSK